jgi:hypothetical protein
MEAAGFQFEKEQKPHLQNRKENELKFVHPKLVKRIEEDGYKVRAKKFYIKPLSDESDCEIGFVTGKSSPLYKDSFFIKPNSSDTVGLLFVMGLMKQLLLKARTIKAILCLHLMTMRIITMAAA